MYIYNIVFRYFGCVCVCIELISRDVVYRTDVLNLILVSFGKSNQENIGEDFFLVVFFFVLHNYMLFSYASWLCCWRIN